MAKISVIHLLLALVIIFAGGCIILWATLPDDYCRACGPVIEVRPVSTFYVYSLGNIPSYRYNGPNFEYSGDEWTTHPDYAPLADLEYRLGEKDTIVSLEADKSYYTPDVKIEGNRLYFDIMLFNNVGYSFPDVKYDVLSDVNIRKNIDGGYGEYSRFEPDMWEETINVENVYVNSLQEIRIYAPLFPVENDESFFVEVYLLYPENLTADDGTKLVYDNGEYIPEEYVPDVYDLSDSDKRRKIRIYEYFIVRSGFEGEV